MKLAAKSLIIVAILLAVPAFSSMQQQQAFAASAIGGIEQRIRINFSDGSFTYATDYKEIFPQEIVGGTSNKQISSFQFETLALFYGDCCWTVTASSIGSKIQVQMPDGSYKTITPSGGRQVQPYSGSTPTNVWLIYKTTILTSDLENAIGQHVSDYKGEIRSTSAGSFDAKDPQGGSHTYLPTSNRAVFSFTAKGTSGGSGCIGSDCVEQPTGKLYSVIVLELTNGGFKTIYTTQLGAIKLADLAIPGEGTSFKSIKYSLRMHLDNDNFNMPLKPVFGDPNVQGNFNTFVGGSPVDNHYNDVIQKIGDAGDYRLLEMTITEADALSHLTQIETDGTFKRYSGNVEFTHTAGYVPLRGSGGQVFKVQLPQKDITYDVIGVVYDNTGGGGSGDCEFAGETTNCNDGGNPPPFNMAMLPYILVGTFVVAGAAGGALYLRKKK